MADKLTQEELLAQFENMTLVELNDFVKAFEDKFDVKAAAPVAVAGAAGGDAGAAEEKSEYDVVLTNAGAKKIQVIKVLKDLTKKGLAEAKALTDKVPSTVLSGVSADDAKKAKEDLEGAGATVELK